MECLGSKPLVDSTLYEPKPWPKNSKFCNFDSFMTYVSGHSNLIIKPRFEVCLQRKSEEKRPKWQNFEKVSFLVMVYLQRNPEMQKVWWLVPPAAHYRVHFAISQFQKSIQAQDTFLLCLATFETLDIGKTISGDGFSILTSQNNVPVVVLSPLVMESRFLECWSLDSVSLLSKLPSKTMVQVFPTVEQATSRVDLSVSNALPPFFVLLFNFWSESC